MPITWPWGDQLIMTDEGRIHSLRANWKRWQWKDADAFVKTWRFAAYAVQPIALGRMDTEGGCYAYSPPA